MTTMRLPGQEQYNGNEWYPDSAATAHITNNAAQLTSSEPYMGNDQVMVGNGDFLPITHIGSIPLHTPQGILPLADVLVCPEITKSLLSVSKFIADYPCEVTFDFDSVFVKDKTTKQVITQGSRHKDLYMLKDARFQAFYSTRQRATSVGIWHKRLGHPHKDILQFLASSSSIVLNKDSTPLLCDACQVGKSCRLPFIASDSVSTKPLEKIHCDVWGPSPIVSSQGFKYYVIFVDDFSRFTWFYPLKFKSDFFSVFKILQSLVETQLQQRILQFQCDGGGEFVSSAFLSHLAERGIKQLMSCPHTPQQNGVSERKHRHITELGTTLMFCSKVPQQLWVEAFFTANFLGNLLPSSVLNDRLSPYEALHGKAPDYTSLRAFGCKCFPYLRPYMKNKLDPKSLVSVFLGYNEKYKGYRCFYPPTGKVFISRHVLFDESQYPFADIYIHLHKPNESVLLQAWRLVNLRPPSDDSVRDHGTEDLPALKRVVQPPVPESPVDDLLYQSHGSASSSSSSDESVEQDNNDGDDDVLAEDQPENAVSVHPMTTRARAGIVKPNLRYALLTVKEGYPEPRSVKAALNDAGWKDAMGVEIDHMVETKMFVLVPPAPDQDPLGCRWVYKTKLNADGTVRTLRARLVAKGNEQEEGVDYIETFSPVVRTATIRTGLHVAVTKKWKIRQLDVQNAFLHGDLKETVYMVQPPGFVDERNHDYVWKLEKAIYGLKQAPRAWFDKFSTFLLDFGFTCSFPNPSLFIYHHGSSVIYLLLYVDDMILTGNDDALVQKLLEELNTEFRMKDMGEIHYFLGIQVQRTEEGMFLSQEKYAT